MTTQNPSFPPNSIFNDILVRIKNLGTLAEDPGDLDLKTPNDVIVTKVPREPISDPTLGIAVKLDPQVDPPRHRLVSVGDSLTQGFQSGAIFNTDISYPAIIAYE